MSRRSPPARSTPCYTLEPTGTDRPPERHHARARGRRGRATTSSAIRWRPGTAARPSLTTEFIKKYPAEAKKYIAAYARGIELVRTKPDEARQYMKGYTAIEGALTAEVPLASYMLYNEFKPSDVAYFQKFYDLFSDKGIFDKQRDRRADAVQGVTAMAETAVRHAPPPWARRGRDARSRRRRTFAAGQAAARRRARCCCSSSGTSWCALGLIKADPAADAARRRSARWSPASPAGRCCSTSASRCCARCRRS